MANVFTRLRCWRCGRKDLMFKFGQGWASFSRQLDEPHIEEATASLTSLFGENALKNRSFLNIGCGGGLFSIAAARLGAQLIAGIDIDPVSVDTSNTNFVHWSGDGLAAHFCSLPFWMPGR